MKKQKKEALYKNQDKQRKLPVIRYYRCNIEKMLDTINIPVIKITTEMLRKYLVEYQMKQYKVEITKEALQDMEDIYNYIVIDLLAPDNAMGAI